MGVLVNGASSTAITNNTVGYSGCLPVFAVGGGSVGTSIENDIVLDSCTESAPLVSVAADSAAGTKSDYNIVYGTSGDPAIYSWTGTSYATAAQLNAATGQGAHDLNVNQPFASGVNQPFSSVLVPAENSPAIDSADDTAPGLLATDFNANSRADDPLVTNTGTGIGYVDRGAVEREDPLAVNVDLSALQAPTGGTVMATLSATPGWAPITGYTVDFGAGTPVVRTTATTVSHTYTAVSSYNVTATVTDARGTTGVVQFAVGIKVVPPAPLIPRVTALPAGPLSADAIANDSTDSWDITGLSCDFGDGSPPVRASSLIVCSHTYSTAGLHRVTVTLTDAGGNTASTSTTLIVQGPGQPQPPPGAHLPSPGPCGTCRSVVLTPARR
jgi:hypothetical protein